METRFVHEMHRFISLHSMIEPEEMVLVAVSGGADSLALLYGLHALHTHLSCNLHVVHLDHSLRDDSVADAEFVQEHAAHLGVPYSDHAIELSLLRKEWKLSVEAAGRKARYDFFESVCAQTGATKVALGHHKDDIAETVLMNLLRGAGSSGLNGISPIRDGKFIRPLAGITRQEIESFLASKKLVPRHDSTNTDNRFLRNRIRHELLPMLEQNYNPNIRTGLIRTAEVLGTESEYLDSQTRKAFDSCNVSLYQTRSIILDKEKFLQHHTALQRRILRYGIYKILGHVNDFSFDDCQAILKIIKGSKPNALLTLPDSFQFKRAYEQLIFEKKPIQTDNFVYPLVVPGKTDIPEVNANIIAEIYDTLPNNIVTLPDGTFEAMFDYDKIDLPLIVRNRRQGDRFQPHGMNGTKKIKDYLVDTKVPRTDRDRIPMLVSGNDILWIIGFTTNEKFRILPQTQRYLHLHYGKYEAVS